MQLEAQAEQPRVMLLSVPYALKAADAETFGGKPPSAYVAAPQSDSSTGTAAALSNGSRPRCKYRSPPHSQRQRYAELHPGLDVRFESGKFELVASLQRVAYLGRPGTDRAAGDCLECEGCSLRGGCDG